MKALFFLSLFHFGSLANGDFRVVSNRSMISHLFEIERGRDEGILGPGVFQNSERAREFIVATATSREVEPGASGLERKTGCLVSFTNFEDVAGRSCKTHCPPIGAIVQFFEIELDLFADCCVRIRNTSCDGPFFRCDEIGFTLANPGSGFAGVIKHSGLGMAHARESHEQEGEYGFHSIRNRRLFCINKTYLSSNVFVTKNRTTCGFFVWFYENREGIESAIIERMMRTTMTPQTMLMALRCFGLRSIACWVTNVLYCTHEW